MFNKMSMLFLALTIMNLCFFATRLLDLIYTREIINLPFALFSLIGSMITFYRFQQFRNF